MLELNLAPCAILKNIQPRFGGAIFFAPVTPASRLQKSFHAANALCRRDARVTGCLRRAKHSKPIHMSLATLQKRRLLGVLTFKLFLPVFG